MEKKLFIVFVIVSCSNRLLEAGGIFIPFIHSWLDDLLCLPIVLYVMLFIFRKYLLSNSIYSFPFIYVLWTIALFSFVFEYYLPLHSHRFTADVNDVFAYAVGGIFFYEFMNGKMFLRSLIAKKADQY